MRTIGWCQLPSTQCRLPHSPSNLPEKLSVARHRFFFLPLFLASGMSMGWLVGMSVPGSPRAQRVLPCLTHLPTGQPSPWPQGWLCHALSPSALTRAGLTLRAEVRVRVVGRV